MIKKDSEIKRLASSSTNNNKNDVKVNNHFSLTINFGDSINVLALIAGIYIIRKVAKRNKNKRLLKQR